jgi:imidazolonepropionase-like amidohydrolase
MDWLCFQRWTLMRRFATPSPAHAGEGTPTPPHTMCAMKRALLVLFIALPLFAQTTPRPVVVRAARMFAGNTDSVVSPGVVVISGNHITAVGSSAAIPPDATVIDLGDATLLPGFIDSHTHLSFEMGSSFITDFFTGAFRHASEQSHYAALYAKRTVDAGFTTVRDLGSFEYIDVGLRNAINSGTIPGPRMFVAVHPIGATGGHGDSDPMPPQRIIHKTVREGTCNGAAQCLEAVRWQTKYGADVIKIMPSGGVLSLSDAVDAPTMTVEEIRTVVEEAHQLGRKVAAHCHGDSAAKIAVAAGVDSIEHGSFLTTQTLQLMKERGTRLVATLSAGESIKHTQFPPAIRAKADAASAAMNQMFRNAVRIGVKIAFGTDSAVYPHGRNAGEFALMTANGMAPAAALRSATSVAAELVGIDAGILAAGRLADVIAVPGNPLQDIRTTEQVMFVMKDGAVVKDARK